MLKLAATSCQEDLSVRGGVDKDLQDLFKQFGFVVGIIASALANLMTGMGGCSRQCK
ncbi:MAG: hypothetical protein QMB59_06825 [Bacteroidales bacterium]